MGSPLGPLPAPSLSDKRAWASLRWGGWVAGEPRGICSPLKGRAWNWHRVPASCWSEPPGRVGSPGRCGGMVGLGGHQCSRCLVGPVGSHTAGLLQVHRFSIPRRIPCEAGQGRVSSWVGGCRKTVPALTPDVCPIHQGSPPSSWRCHGEGHRTGVRRAVRSF